jgi:class 3 adenylate cyclase
MSIAVTGATGNFGRLTVEALLRRGVPAEQIIATGRRIQGEEVRGIAVHAAARILGVARPGEVLVSTTIHDLLSGSGLEFADRGEFELRGLDGRRSLAALVR